jgi:glycosyltransferase involved in cell wall biosynthesis
MRVLLCHQPTDGGVGRHVADVAEGLVGKGFDVVLCSPALPKGLQAPVTHVPLDIGRAVTPRADLAALGSFAGTVRRLRPDVIHAHSSKAGVIARVARLSQPRTPVLYTPHGYAFAGHFSRESERRAYRAIERALAPLASLVVCVCEAEARLARSIGPSARVRVVHNGVEITGARAVEPRIAELSKAGPVIGALTLLRPGKGLETLLAALPAVLGAHPSAQIAIVGDGPDLEELRASAHDLGVAHAVHFLGASSEPLSSLRGMDVFVHPSWAESFPYVILEAMSLGLPILASDVGGIGEEIVDGQSGLLVPARDQDALARALIELLNEPARARQMGEGALNRVQERFTRAQMVDHMASLYEQATGRSALYFGAERVDDESV